MLTALIIAAILTCIAFIFMALSVIDAVKSYKNLAESAKKNIELISRDTAELKNKAIQSLDELSVVKTKLVKVLDDVSDLKNEIVDSLHSVESLAKTVDNSAKDIGTKVETLFKKLEPLENLTKLLYSMVANPINNSISIFNATKKALSAFSGKLFSK